MAVSEWVYIYDAKVRASFFGFMYLSVCQSPKRRMRYIKNFIMETYVRSVIQECSFCFF